MGWKEPEFKTLTSTVETLKEVSGEIEKQNTKALEDLIFVLEGKKEIDDGLESKPDSSTSTQ